MQFILILCNGLLLFSKLLKFLSFHMVHQIIAGTILHLLLSVLPLPSKFQLSRACPVLSGTVQLIPLKLVNKFHNCPTTLQCRNRWLIVSANCSQKQHPGHNSIPLFIRFSCVRTASFSTNQELYSKQYRNFKFQQPYEQALYYCSLILREHSWSWNDEFEVLTNLEIDDLVKFYPLLLSRTFLECYIAGNIDSKEAVSMIQYVEDALYKGSQPLSRALFASEHSASRIINLEESKNYFYAAEGLNTSDENSALVHYIQVHSDEYIKNVKLQLFSLIAKQPAFDQLRSVEQLGYITSLSRTSDAGVRGLQLIVQSSVKDPRYIESRFQAFLKTLETQLHDMSDDEFKKKANALIDIKLEKFKNLPEETNFFWWEISSGTLRFDRIENEVAALKQITKMDLIDFFNEYVNVGAPKRKSLSLQVFGSSHSSEFKSEKVDPVEPNVVQIEDIFRFRRSRPLHHSLKGDLVHLKAHDVDHQ